jgi:hypothetical protein
MKISLTGAAAVVASAGALFFALGYVVVNARLASYGVNEVAPPSARFVSVGMLASVFLGAAYLVRFIPTLRPELLAARLRAAPPRGRRTSRGWIALRALAVLALAILVMSVLETSVVAAIAQPTDDREPGYLLEFLVAWNVLPIVTFMLLPLGGPWWAPAFDLTPARPGLTVLRALLAIPPLVLTLALYSQSAFKYVPQWLGGGRLASVQLVLAPEDQALCPECAVAGAAYALLDDDDRIVLFLNLDNHRRVIELPRSLVKSVIHAPP